MLKRAVGFVADGALPVSLVAEVYRMLKLTVRRKHGFSAEGLVDGRVTYIAVVSNHLSFAAEMLTVVASKTALRVEMTDIVRVR